MNKYLPFKYLTLGLLILTLNANVRSQDSDPAANYREQIKRLVGFLEFTLNTLGDPETSTREKEVIINESYLKAFLHEKVQVEDDLDENREIFTYKDVQAYLKDVDFFFKTAEFNLTIQDIQSLTNDQGMPYFKVTINRNLKGETVENEKISNNKTRYIEINLDDNEQVLKIVSIYTTRLNEAAEMMAWWNSMPYAWKDELGSGYNVVDEIRLSEVDFLSADTLLFIRLVHKVIDIDKFIYIGSDSLLITEKDTMWVEQYDTIAAKNNLGLRMLKEISGMETLDLSGNTEIDDLSPVSQMSGVKILNIAGTMVSDLFPARNLNKLASLDITGTSIKDLSPIQYNTLTRELYLDSSRIASLSPLAGFDALEVLHLSGTPVADLGVIRNLTALRDLRLDQTAVMDLSPVADLVNLENLSFSGTGIADLSPVEYLVGLKRIYFEGTPVSDLQHIGRLENLQLIDADSTRISDLGPLKPLPLLEKVYCDQTGVSRSHANRFMEEKPTVLVIYESEGLNAWWASLDEAWKTVFRGLAELGPLPTREQLHKLTLLRTLDIRENRALQDLKPVVALTNLKELNASHTNLGDLSPLSEIIDIKTLLFSQTPVSDLTPLRSLIYLENLDFSGSQVVSLEGLNSITSLKTVNFDRTGISDLEALKASHDIRIIYCDQTGITQATTDAFLDVHPDVLVIFKTPALEDWWSALPPAWKAIFKAQSPADEPLTREQLAIYASLRKLDISGNREAADLSPIRNMSRLEDLNCSNTGARDISPISGLVRLKKLNISGNPVSDLASMTALANLIHLDISNTPVSKIDALRNLTAMEHLNLSGTAIKKLDPLAGMTSLKRLEIYNTGINNLKPLAGLVSLRYLACYNTKLSAKKVAAFRDIMPTTEVVFY